MGGGTTNNPFVATFKDQPPIGGDLTKNPFTSSFIPPPGKKRFSLLNALDPLIFNILIFRRLKLLVRENFHVTM